MPKEQLLVAQAIADEALSYALVELCVHNNPTTNYDCVMCIEERYEERRVELCVHNNPTTNYDCLMCIEENNGDKEEK